MREINDDNFNKNIIHSKESLPFLLFFHSKKCKYCYVMENIINNIEKEYKNKFLFFSILIDENELIKDNYMIKGTPTTFIFDKENNLIKRIYGSNINIIELKNIFDRLVSKEEPKEEKESFFSFLFKKKDLK